MTTALTKAVQVALQNVPCSNNALAQAAGVPQSTVSRIRSGDREATPQVAERLADALEHWATDCTRAAARIRRATGRA